MAFKEPSNVQQTFSSERAPTVWQIIPSLEFLIKRWESMVYQAQFREVKGAIEEGIESLKKWYRRVDGTSAAYFICLGKLEIKYILHKKINKVQWLVLDPNVKDLYCRHRWDLEQYEAGMKRLEEVVRRSLLKKS